MESYQPLQERAYIHLKNLILNDELESGVIYSETKMAKELNISRTPFKAALVRLSQDKYVDIIPSKGFRVHVLSEADIETTFQTRTAIELFCTLMLMERQETREAEETLKKMDQTIAAMQELIRYGEDAVGTNRSSETDGGNLSGTFEEQDRIFHSTLVRFAENDEFNRLYDYLIYHQVVSAVKGHQISVQEKETTCREHASILEAIRSRSQEACCSAVRQHMQTNEKNGLMNLRQGN